MAMSVHKPTVVAFHHGFPYSGFLSKINQMLLRLSIESWDCGFLVKMDSHNFFSEFSQL